MPTTTSSAHLHVHVGLLIKAPCGGGTAAPAAPRRLKLRSEVGRCALGPQESRASQEDSAVITEAWRHSSNLPVSRTSDGDVEALGAAHEAEVVAAVELELAHLVKS